MEEKIESLLKSGKIKKEVADKLKNLLPGNVVNHRFWGLGNVESMDIIMNKIQINFENKPSHSMQVGFALKSLEFLPKDEVLSRWKINPKEIEDYASDSPVDFIDDVLKSKGGCISISDFEQIVCGRMVARDDYKTWLDKARRESKKSDKKINIPNNKTGNIEYLKDRSEIADELAQKFEHFKDYKKKYSVLTHINKNLDAFSNNKDLLVKVLENLNSYLELNKNINFMQSLELFFLREDIKAKYEQDIDIDNEVSLDDFIKENIKKLVSEVENFGIVMQRKIIGRFPSVFKEDLLDVFKMLLKKASFGLNSELYKLACKSKIQDEFLAYLNECIEKKQLSLDSLAWICASRKELPGNVLNNNLINTICFFIDHEDSDKPNKINILQEKLIDDKEAIGDLLDSCDASMVKNFTRKILQSSSIEELNKRSILARIVKSKPEMTDLISGSSKVKTSKGDGSLVVSWESLEKKRQEYEDITKVKIPENSKEIAVARSYGDLRENFEFKAAKEMQRVLMKRKSEMEAELSLARGTDYKNPDVSKVSIGTKVKLKEKNGKKVIEYSILGAWDGDPDNFILSYASKTGRAILNKKVGDIVSLSNLSGIGKDIEEKEFEIIGIKAHLS